MGVAICIYPPIDWPGLCFPSLEPDRQSFFAIKNGKITQAEYEKRYYQNILSKLNPQQIYDMFSQNVLLCWEEPGQFCHRRLVAQWIEKALNIEVPEWSPSDEIKIITKNKRLF